MAPRIGEETVTVDGHPFPTLGDVDLAVITCSHAAKHLWHRLELLAQIAALTRRSVDWDAVEQLAALSAQGIKLRTRALVTMIPPNAPAQRSFRRTSMSSGRSTRPVMYVLKRRICSLQSASVIGVRDRE